MQERSVDSIADAWAAAIQVMYLGLYSICIRSCDEIRKLNKIKEINQKITENQKLARSPSLNIVIRIESENWERIGIR